MRRRSLLLAASAVLLWPLAGLASPIQGLRPRGRGSFRRFGFLVYDASLWTGNVPDGPPLALRLDYRRKLSGQAIAEASVDEMRRFVTDEAQLAAWEQAMRRIFPDVRDGEHLLGVWRDEGAYFYQNDKLIGAVRDPAFARAFFAIWLDPRSSAPALRAALLGES